MGYEEASLEKQATLLAERLDFQLDKEAETCLFLGIERLIVKTPHFSPLYADFSAAVWNKRCAEGKKQGLIKACKPKPGMHIIDATAGWGRDAAILAGFGAQVMMLERHPVMVVLLEDALNHQSEADRQRLKLSLQAQDALSVLSTLNEKDFPDVIYIDPMHPERNKSALVKKDMQMLQDLIGPDEDALALILLAQKCAKQRVVVKWPQKINPLLPPSYSIAGKTIRFDVYH